MLYGPWPRSGRLLRHLCCSSSFAAQLNPGGAGHVKGARAHRAERGRPLTWPRQDYIALLEEEEQRRSNRQPPAAARGGGELPPGAPPPCWRSSREDWPARGRGTQPASKRPIDLQRSAATRRGVGTRAPRAASPPRCAAEGRRRRSAWHSIGSRRTGRAQRRRCRPLCPLGGRRGEARRSVHSSALPSLRGAGTSPGSPAVAGAVRRRRRISRCTDRSAGGCADRPTAGCRGRAGAGWRHRAAA